MGVIRDRGIELLLSSNIAPRFEDTEHKETYTPSFSGPKGGTQNAKRICYAYIIYINIYARRIGFVYCAEFI
jgi:hypothetical protein